MAAIPVGSKLSELERYLPKLYDSSSIREWRSDRSSGDVAHRTTSYGSFCVYELGEYALWKATKSERDAFTGELLFYHHRAIVPDDLAPSYVFSLIYVKGVLKEKDYGHLPG
ncbi:MAG: hypothetical protein IT203_09725 [Fimbriimonadaceae bacterium]|nr:hypothetical protein [Fimbriimonadaceae bacterium]